jgi:hypothetical protein
MEEPLKFATRVDRWLAAVGFGYVALALGLPAWHLGSVLSAGQPVEPMALLLPLGTLAIVWLVSVPCNYELQGKFLMTRTGYIKFKVPLLAITRVRRRRTFISAPAWSMDRLEIRYGRTQRLLVSPEREDEFLRELQARAPQLMWAGDELVVSPEWTREPGERKTG